ncbi:hypothetical protein BUALT_Bualt12G0065400 [Buddleja alternifolia]|uniref:Receptor ligand binding region domain-containing protein n=1 Tax=Buddleja alternifolia TaxID=168488 RepID=A0AAV6WN55_9LAMI|nr:hypothetical protein BUALT_Bualt12G0065400 [Buddleja alternifolia]
MAALTTAPTVGLSETFSKLKQQGKLFVWIAKALATICKRFEWPEVAVEDADSGNQFLSRMNKAFQEVDIGLAYMIAIPKSAEGNHLPKELKKFTTKQTRVFLVHMNPYLGYRLFTLAKGVGLMCEGYAWIFSTDSLSSFISSMDFDTRVSMEGVLGISPYICRSKDLESFQERWKRNMITKNTSYSVLELNVYGLWAYDTSGDFQLVDGKLKPSTFEILNVIGTGEKTIGFWTPDRGIIREWSSIGETNY